MITDKGNKQTRLSTGRIPIKCGDSSYAYVLKTLKTKVDIESLGVNVRNIRILVKGDVLLELEGSKGNANRLEEAIMEKVKNTELSIRRPETAIHILDLNAVTTEDKEKKPL